MHMSNIVVWFAFEFRVAMISFIVDAVSVDIVSLMSMVNFCFLRTSYSIFVDIG